MKAMVTNPANMTSIQLVVASQYAAPRFEAAEQPFDLVALPIKSFVQFPGLFALGMGRYDRNKAKPLGKFPRFVAFVGAIHQQCDRTGWRQWAQWLSLSAILCVRHNMLARRSM